MVTTTVRPKRSVQIPLLKAAALALAGRQGETIVVSNHPITEVKLDGLYFWLTPFGTLGPHANLDVWDEGSGGNKVLSMNWGADDSIAVLSFRRGDWEQVIIGKARQDLH